MHEGDDHLALVFGYGGAGDDRHMLAVLFQASLTNANVQLLRHDGQFWACEDVVWVPRAARAGMPSGPLRIAWAGDAWVIDLNDEAVMHLAGTDLPEEPRGFRWSGASIRPLDSASMTPNGDNARK